MVTIRRENIRLAGNRLIAGRKSVDASFLQQRACFVEIGLVMEHRGVIALQHAGDRAIRAPLPLQVAAFFRITFVIALGQKAV